MRRGEALAKSEGGPVARSALALVNPEGHYLRGFPTPESDNAVFR
jgi:hypothetical protein